MRMYSYVFLGMTSLSWRRFGFGVGIIRRHLKSSICLYKQIPGLNKTSSSHFIGIFYGVLIYVTLPPWIIVPPFGFYMALHGNTVNSSIIKRSVCPNVIPTLIGP